MGHASTAVSIMRVCLVSLFEGHSQAKCTLCCSLVALLEPQIVLGGIIAHVLHRTWLMRSTYFATRGINASTRVIFLWQERKARLGLLEGHPSAALVQSNWRCRSTARAERARPCTESSREQLCTHWILLVEMCPTPGSPPGNSPSTSQPVQVPHFIQADPAKARSSSDRDMNNSSFVWHSFKFLFLLISWAAAVDLNTYIYIYIYRTSIHAIREMDIFLLYPYPSVHKLTSVDQSFYYQHLSPYINSSDKMKFRYRPLTSGWCKWVYTDHTFTIPWEAIIPTTSSLMMSPDCIAILLQIPWRKARGKCTP